MTAAAHSRAFSFCGSDGVEIMEPLSFKGRRGSGIAGDRTAYADASLAPRWDWEKYAYGHRVWGRLLYNPDAEPDTWRRYLTSDSSARARRRWRRRWPTPAGSCPPSPRRTRLRRATTVLAGGVPESFAGRCRTSGPYTDTPAPRVFGDVSPLDPQLFSRINDFADELLEGERNGKYSPIEWRSGSKITRLLLPMHCHARIRQRRERTHPTIGA